MRGSFSYATFIYRNTPLITVLVIVFVLVLIYLCVEGHPK